MIVFLQTSRPAADSEDFIGYVNHSAHCIHRTTTIKTFILPYTLNRFGSITCIFGREGNPNKTNPHMKMIIDIIHYII